MRQRLLIALTGSIYRDEAVNAAVTAASTNILSRQVRPNVNDLFDKLLNNRIADLVEENRVGR